MARLKALLLLASVALLGCPGRQHYPGPYGDKVADDVPQIESEMGVRFRQPPKLEVRTRDQVRQFLIANFQATTSQQDLAGEEATYKLLGLIPDTLNLKKFLVDLLTEQVIGYYDPKTKVLYVVQNAPQELVGTTIMHELVHALQDQYFNLDSLQHVTGDDDRQLAAQAVIEGQATYEQMAIMVGGHGNIAARMPGGWDRIRDEIRENQSAMPIFSAAPMVIREQLLFPYINGADFIKRFRDHYPGKLPFGNMPQSTRQLMHDAAYFGKTPEPPLRVTLPPLAGKFFENDMGEFGTRLFLYKWTDDVKIAARSADGWAGDRYALVKTPSGNAMVWASAWDTPLDAAEFVDTFGPVTMRRYDIAAPKIAGAVRTYAGAKRTVQVTQTEIHGKNLVLVVDVPAGVSPNLADVSRVGIGN